MSQALLTAELLAQHVTRGLGTGDGWLAAYERERQALLRDYRLLTRMVLGLAAHPRLAHQALRLFGAMPALLSHLVGVAGGVRQLVPPTLVDAIGYKQGA